MNVVELPQFLREAFAVYEAFRRLGFSADEIRPIIGNQGGEFKIALVTIKEQEGLEVTRANVRFVVSTGIQEIPLDEMKELWPRAADAWNKATDKEMQTVWEESDVANNGVAFIAALQSKGIALPCVAVRH